MLSAKWQPFCISLNVLKTHFLLSQDLLNTLLLENIGPLFDIFLIWTLFDIFLSLQLENCSNHIKNKKSYNHKLITIYSQCDTCIRKLATEQPTIHEQKKYHKGIQCYRIEASWVSKKTWQSGQETYFGFLNNVIHKWVRSRNCGCLVTWFCYQLIAKPGNKTATVSWPDPNSYSFLKMIKSLF